MVQNRHKDVGSEAGNFRWNTIFDIDEENYKKCLEWTRSYYRSVDPSDYKNLAKCVDHAIRTGNHTAFAHFYLCDNHRQATVFCRMLGFMINRQKKVLAKGDGKENLTRLEAGTSKNSRNRDAQSIQLEAFCTDSIHRNEKKVKQGSPAGEIIAGCWNKAPLVMKKYWRSFDYSFDELIRLNEKNGGGVFYSIGKDGKESPGRRKWRKGESIPSREAIVQIGISLALSIEDTNALLMSAGESVLYVLDPVDVCSMFTLEKYKGNYSIDAEDKLRETKTEINQILLKCYEQNVPFLKFVQGHRLVSKQPLIMNINSEISGLRKILETNTGENRDNENSPSNTRFLTEYYKKRIEEFIVQNDLAKFIDLGCVKAPKGGFEENNSGDYVLFLQKYYGFIKKTKDFLLNPSSYIKNQYYTDWNLTVDGYADNLKHMAGVEELISQHMRMRAAVSDKNQTDNFEENRDKLQINHAIREVEKIFFITDTHAPTAGKENLTVANLRKIKGRSKGSLSLLRQLVEGRNVGQDSDAEEKGTGYQMDLSSRSNLIKFAVATGNEDSIDYYMNLSGMWARNWYTDYQKVFHDQALLNKLQDESDCFLGRADYLILYALLLRDRLIREWQAAAGFARPEAERIRKAFPLIQLLLQITRDITLAFMKLEKPADGSLFGDYDHAPRTYNQKKGIFEDLTKQYEDRLYEMMSHEMIFPVSWYYLTKLIPFDEQEDADHIRERKRQLQLNKGSGSCNNVPCWKKQIPYP